MGSNSTCGSPRNLRATRDPRSALRLRGTGRRGQQGVRLSEIRERREIREGESGREGIVRSRQDREGINSSAARSASDARSAKGSPRSPGPMSCRDRQRPSDLTACGCSSAWGAAPSGQALRASSCLLAPFGASAALPSPPCKPRAASRSAPGPAQHSWRIAILALVQALTAVGSQPSSPGGCGHYFCITDVAARSARSASERDLACAVQGPPSKLSRKRFTLFQGMQQLWQVT